MRLEFGVAVRTDFAVEVDLFVLRCGPFHRRRSFSLVIQDGETVSQLTKEGNSPNAPRRRDGAVANRGRATIYRQNEERESQRVVVVLNSTVGNEIQQNLHRGREFPLTTLRISLRCGRKWQKVVDSRVK